MTSGPAVRVEDVTFRYAPAAEPVLMIPELTIAAGEQVFLHGPSGSGKTTLLGLLAGILTPQGGRISVLGRDLGRLSGHERDRLRGAEIGYIFQMFNLIPYLSVRDNILLPCRLSAARRARLRGDGQAEAEELAAHLKIAHLLDAKVTALSVGQQQRVAAARALIGKPGLIIADEPTSALDTAHREAFLELMFAEAARAAAAVLFVSHDHTLMPLFKRVVPLAEINRAAKVAAF